MLPIYLNIKNWNVLVIGAGSYGTRKALELLKEGAHVSLISTSTSGNKELFEFPNLNFIKATYTEKHLELNNYRLVWACTDSTEINKKILDECEARQILCSSANNRKESHFSNPGKVHWCDLDLAISSKGQNLHSTLAFKDQLKHLNQKWDWPTNTVILAGFGPGDAGLMTLHAFRALHLADVIFYDDLIDFSFIEKLDCTLVYVGKRKGQHYLKQDEINKLLIEYAQKGLKVLRLKGGDPFIFGRGGEEVLALREVGIHTKTIPGITAATGASASQCLPLTHRNSARKVTFQTAHHLDESNPELPTEGTLVLYMGASKLEFLQQLLLKKGWDSNTGVLMVQNATQKNERAEKSSIKKMHLSSLKSPLCIIITKNTEIFS